LSALPTAVTGIARTTPLSERSQSRQHLSVNQPDGLERPRVQAQQAQDGGRDLRGQYRALNGTARPHASAGDDQRDVAVVGGRAAVLTPPV
jgi:hypothetical protein